MIPRSVTTTFAAVEAPRTRAPERSDIASHPSPLLLSEARLVPPVRPFRADIQGLRAIAVLLVVLYHAKVPGVSGGYVGVDVFFVISGFLITSQLVREVARTGRVHFLSFYAARARRLLPAAAVVIIATLAVARFALPVLTMRSVTKDAAFSAVYALNYRLASQGVDYQHAGDAVSPLQHLWSLAVEEQFYLFWPLIVMSCVLVGRRRRTPVLVLATAAIVTVSLYLSVTVTVSSPPYAYFSVHTRAWELLSGALLAFAGRSLTRVPGWLAATTAWTGLAAIVTSGLLYDDGTPFPGSAALLPVLGTVLVIGAGGGGEHRLRADRLLSLPPLQGMGKVSYSWYLWHWPVVVLVPLLLNRSFGWPLKLVLMVLALGLAVLTLHLVENPARKARMRKILWLPTGVGIGLASIVTAAAVASTLPSLVGTGAAAAPIVLTSASTDSVQLALAQGVRVTKAPVNLTPSIEQAPADHPVSNSDGCNAKFLETITQGDCVYGDLSGEHTLVVFGDSHMQQWLPAISSEAKAVNWKVVAWTKSGCPIAQLPVFRLEALGRDYTECPLWRRYTEKRIRALHPDVVLMSQSDRVGSKHVGSGRWADATAETSRHLRLGNTRIAYLLDTPYPPGDMPACVAGHLDDVRPCNYPVAKALRFSDRRIAIRSALVGQHAQVLDPLSWFCTSSSGICPAVVGNTLVYRDDSHMSTAYSRYLAPALRALFVTRG